MAVVSGTPTHLVAKFFEAGLPSAAAHHLSELSGAVLKPLPSCSGVPSAPDGQLQLAGEAQPPWQEQPRKMALSGQSPAGVGTFR